MHARHRIPKPGSVPSPVSKRRIPGFVLAALLLCSSVPLTLAASETFVVTAGGSGNEVIFESHAPLESFEGRTQQIQGTIRLDPEALGDSIEVFLEVDLASLDTGIDLRNRHMRDNHLHTDQYPKAVFKGARFEETPARLEPNRPVAVTGTGRFELHGKSQDGFPFQAELTLLEDEEGRRLQVRTEFVVFLADFDIPRPKFLFVKLDEKQQITAEMIARPKDASTAELEAQ